jgi:uncharacterized protein (DUF1800 family)
MDNSPKALKAIADDEMRKAKKKEFEQRAGDLNLLWVEAMMHSSFPLLEKTALFWHGHFATHINNPYFDQLLLNIFRKQGLGNFRDLLMAVSKSPAMLQYLNNKQNKKSHPNENFAREVMELFTLGRGNYTEDDVKEAARAFTGWNYDDEGDFVFKDKQHDYGTKTFFGKTGNFNGDDIINMICDRKETAEWITTKLYKYYLSDVGTDAGVVRHIAGRFYDSGLDISALIKDLFSSRVFAANGTLGAKVKSPVELLIGYGKVVPVSFSNPQAIIRMQKILGQYLFNPPNVAGWAGGKAWINSASLVARMRLPEALYGSGTLDFEVKESGDDGGGSMRMKDMALKLGKIEADWTDYLAYWLAQPREHLPELMAQYLFPFPIAPNRIDDVERFADKSSPEVWIKSLTLRFMELPEYQLC